MGPTYLLENNLRRVSPYYFEYKTPYKQRWHLLSVKEILTRELGQSPDVVDHAIEMGHIYVTCNNGKAEGSSVLRFAEARLRLLKPHDIIHNLQHMHEPPVWCEPRALLNHLKSFWKEKADSQTARLVGSSVVLFENDHLIVVDKPPGVPTHPSGIYRYNSMTEVLHHDLGYPVWPCHRLDKGTLGVLVLAKTKSACKAFQALLQSEKQSMEKWYVARVNGDFPHEFCTYASPVFSINTAGTGYLNANAEAIAAGPVTHFRRLLYSPKNNQSIVLCRPITGKMHQIRIHLRNMGYPIANDPIYNLAGGPNAEKSKVETDIYGALLSKWNCFGLNKAEPLPETVDVSPILAEMRSRIDYLSTLRRKADISKVVSTCSECLRPIHQDNPDGGIYLHAWKMSYNGEIPFYFQTSYPSWIFSDTN